jgi:hypothetical protein
MCQLDNFTEPVVTPERSLSNMSSPTMKSNFEEYLCVRLRSGRQEINKLGNIREQEL